MNDIERKRIEDAVAAFVAKHRPPAHLRNRVDLGFRFDGRSVEIFETSPRWDDPAQRVENPVAKSRYLKSRDSWLVYWQRADLRWHKYDPVPEVSTIVAFLKLVAPKTSMRVSSGDSLTALNVPDRNRVQALASRSRML